MEHMENLQVVETRSKAGGITLNVYTTKQRFGGSTSCVACCRASPLVSG